MKKTPRTYEVVDVTKDKIFIIDLDLGKTITNNAEAIVAKLHRYFPNRRIIYRDTDRKWDELKHTDGQFTGFAPYTEELPTIFQSPS